MNPFKNLFNSRLVKNASQVQDGFNSYSNTNSLYTRDISKYFDGLNKGGKYDNYYGDYSRIIQTAPTFPIYYVDKNGQVDDTSEIAKYLAQPNDNYPQYKVLQQIYSEMLTHGYCDLFLWRKDGKNESKHFEDKLYKETDFRGFTLVSGYDSSRFTLKDKKNIVRILYGVSQQSVFLGYSPTQAAQSWRKMQDEMGLHMTAFARNAGMPLGTFLITAPNVEAYTAIKDKLESKVAGAKNNGKVLFNWKPTDAGNSQIEWVQYTSQDVQDYTQQLEFSEKKMSQSFGVPGTIKGTNDDASYATARVSEQVFIKYTIKPLITDLLTQLDFAIRKRFEVAGGIKCNIIIPEIADESLVKIRATESQVKLFDTKRAEGYTKESIVAAYDLPESFLLLETEEDAANAANKAKKLESGDKKPHSHVNKNELLRRYQNTLTQKELDAIEADFRKVTDEYVEIVLKNGVVDANRREYETNMSVTFSAQYQTLYAKSLKDVTEALLDTLGVADVAELDLTAEELEEAVKQYRKRVDEFSQTFTDDVANMPGSTLEVRRAAAQPNIDRVVVTESEHTRIVSELGSWTKAQEDFPVRVIKKWNTLPGACEECLALENVEIDVTELFIQNPTNEIYEVVGGGLHPNCRCYCTFIMEGEDVRRFEGGE